MCGPWTNSSSITLELARKAPTQTLWIRICFFFWKDINVWESLFCSTDQPNITWILSLTLLKSSTSDISLNRRNSPVWPEYDEKEKKSTVNGKWKFIQCNSSLRALQSGRPGLDSWFCDLPVSLPENHFKISLLSAEMKHADPQFHCTLCCVFHYVRLISKIIQGLHNYIQSGHSFQWLNFILYVVPL